MPANAETNNTWAPGGLNKMFERIVAEHNEMANLTNPEQKPYEMQILLQPKKRTSDDSEAAMWEEEKPWVVMIDNFLTDTECDTLIQLGTNRGYEQSKDVGAKKFDGTYDSNLSPGRTSTNAWCQDECMESPVTQTVIAKIENLTGIPDANAEYLQLLKYEEGQLYQQHHDFIDFHTERAQGVRILTVFLYLNDVEEGRFECFACPCSMASLRDDLTKWTLMLGGGTNFPILKVVR
jgi:prolyl 4-hydroxylase